MRVRTLRSGASTVSRLAVAAVLVVGMLVGFGPFRSVSQADMECEMIEGDDGGVEYVCRDEDEGNDGDDGSNGDLPCDLSLVEGRPNPHCRGELACWANIPSAAYPDPEDWPEDPPSEDAVYIYYHCYSPDGSFYDSDWGWYDEDEPSTSEEAWEAFGRLPFPDFELAFSPAGRSLVDFDTWFWADGPGSEPITGTSAGGVVAVATPSHIEVDPGDGSAAMTCEWVVEESDTCSYVYEQASVDGVVTSADGDPAYDARARLAYDIHFELGGSILDIPGLPPSTFTTEWSSTPVPVAEAQSVVVER